MSTPLEGDCDPAKSHANAYQRQSPNEYAARRRLRRRKFIHCRETDYRVRMSTPLEGDCDMSRDPPKSTSCFIVRMSTPLEGDCDIAGSMSAHPVDGASPNEYAARRRLRLKVKPPSGAFFAHVRMSTPLEGDCDSTDWSFPRERSWCRPNEYAARRRLRHHQRGAFPTVLVFQVRMSTPLEGDCDLT